VRAVKYTGQRGIPVSDAQHSLRIGTRGPPALEDFRLREKIFPFDHERLPERVVHAHGSGRARPLLSTYTSIKITEHGRGKM
jgi:catalase